MGVTFRSLREGSEQVINTLIGLGIGAIVAGVATFSGVSIYQDSGTPVPHSKLYSYSDN